MRRRWLVLLVAVFLVTGAESPVLASVRGLRQAEQAVRRAGYRVVNTNGFTPGLPLKVLIGYKADSGDGYAKQAFFFYRGRYLGTDTAHASASIYVQWQNDDTVALLYVLYRPSDPMCCPTGGGAIVRYHWNGSRLVPLDPIPSDSDQAALSRR